MKFCIFFLWFLKRYAVRIFCSVSTNLFDIWLTTNYHMMPVHLYFKNAWQFMFNRYFFSLNSARITQIFSLIQLSIIVCILLQYYIVYEQNKTFRSEKKNKSARKKVASWWKPIKINKILNICVCNNNLREKFLKCIQTTMHKRTNSSKNAKKQHIGTENTHSMGVKNTSNNCC